MIKVLKKWGIPLGLLTLGAIAVVTPPLAAGLKPQPLDLPQSPSPSPDSPYYISQTPPFALDGQPVYVNHQGQWREALLTGYQWHSTRGYQYTVLFVESQTTATGVKPDRIKTLENATQAGIATNVYDLQSSAGVQQMLEAHNRWRSTVGVPPLRWSNALANYAQEWAQTLLQNNKFEHRSPSPYGENLAMASGQMLSPARVVDMWGDEVADYDYGRNHCQRGKMCGHYTQVVWKNTTEVGCAVARNDRREVWVCNYNPPGNYIGQRPY